MERKLNFEQLVACLTKEGYPVRVTTHKGLDKGSRYSFAFIQGNGVIAGFGSPENEDCYRYINGRIAADNIDCFDKWSKCPLVMKLPVDADELLKHLTWLASKEGYEHSNGYDYLDKRKLPYEIEPQK